MLRQKQPFALIYTTEFEKLNYGPDHPFRRDRFIFTRNYFKEKFPELPIIEPRNYDLSLLKKVHTQDYINLVMKLSKRGRGYLSIDTPIFPGIFEWAISYTWASLTATELVYENSFSLVFNPCGGLHHAKRNEDGGFCVFNDVALAGMYLYEKDINVAIVDIDAHAGDGTMLILYDKPILKISIHEDPFFLYPGTGFIDQVGTKEGYGYTINIPLPPGSTDDILVQVFREIVRPALMECDPEIIILQSGVDGYRKDTLTHLRYTIHGYHEISKELKKICNKIVMLGGGGYSLREIPILWATIFSTLIDKFNRVKVDAEEIDPKPTKSDEDLRERAELVIRKILETHPYFTKK